MARNEIAFLVNLQKNQNVSSRSYGRFFPVAEKKEALSLKGFARHLAEHGKLASYEMLVLVLQNIVSCMKELATQGQPVKLDGLGQFYPSIESVKGGAVSVEKALELGPDALIAGVHLRFLPEGSEQEELTSRQLKKACVFQFKDLITVNKKTIEGKEKTYHERTPLDTYGIATHVDPEP